MMGCFLKTTEKDHHILDKNLEEVALLETEKGYSILNVISK